MSDLQFIVSFSMVSIFTLFSIFTLKKSKNNSIYILLFYFIQLWTIWSCLYIETGVYISEQMRYGYYIGSTIRLTLLNFIFFIFLNIFLEKEKRIKYTENINVSKRIQFIFNIFIIFMLTLIALFFINIYISLGGFSNDTNLLRVIFYKDISKIKILSFFNGYMNQFLFITGAIYAKSIKNLTKKTCIIIYIFSIIYFILLGNKFGALLIGSVSFFLPISLLSKKVIEFKITNKKIFLFILIFLLLVIGLSIREYSNYNNVSNPFEYLLYRFFGLQGHTWWGTDYMYQLGEVDTKLHLMDEIRGVFNPNEMYYRTGIRYLMQLIAPQQIYNYYFESGLNFATAYPAISIVSFGYIGTILIQIVFSYLVYKFLIIMKKSLIRNDLFLWFCISYIFNEIYYVFSMGSISHVIRGMTLVVVSYMILVNGMNYIKTSRGKRKWVK